jgi:hypothetical protein
MYYRVYSVNSNGGHTLLYVFDQFSLHDWLHTTDLLPEEYVISGDDNQHVTRCPWCSLRHTVAERH